MQPKIVSATFMIWAPLSRLGCCQSCLVHKFRAEVSVSNSFDLFQEKKMFVQTLQCLHCKMQSLPFLCSNHLHCYHFSSTCRSVWLLLLRASKSVDAEFSLQISKSVACTSCRCFCLEVARCCVSFSLFLLSACCCGLL